MPAPAMMTLGLVLPWLRLRFSVTSTEGPAADAEQCGCLNEASCLLQRPGGGLLHSAGLSECDLCARGTTGSPARQPSAGRPRPDRARSRACILAIVARNTPRGDAFSAISSPKSDISTDCHVAQLADLPRACSSPLSASQQVESPLARHRVKGSFWGIIPDRLRGPCIVTVDRKAACHEHSQAMPEACKGVPGGREIPRRIKSLPGSATARQQLLRRPCVSRHASHRHAYCQCYCS